jgi:hypothetical protein
VESTATIKHERIVSCPFGVAKEIATQTFVCNGSNMMYRIPFADPSPDQDDQADPIFLSFSSYDGRMRFSGSRIAMDVRRSQKGTAIPDA